MAIKIEYSVSGIRKAIKSVCNRATSLQDDVQRVALACLQHTRDHGDWTLCVELVEGISSSNGIRKTALRQYMEAMLHATYGKDESTDRMVFAYDKGMGKDEIDMDQAQLVKWYDFKPTNAPHHKDKRELAETFAKAMKKSVKAGKVSPEDELAALKFLNLWVDGEVEVNVAESAEVISEEQVEELRKHFAAA